MNLPRSLTHTHIRPVCKVRQHGGLSHCPARQGNNPGTGIVEGVHPPLALLRLAVVPVVLTSRAQARYVVLGSAPREVKPEDSPSQAQPGSRCKDGRGSSRSQSNISFDGTTYLSIYKASVRSSAFVHLHMRQRASGLILSWLRTTGSLFNNMPSAPSPSAKFRWSRIASKAQCYQHLSSPLPLILPQTSFGNVVRVERQVSLLRAGSQAHGRCGFELKRLTAMDRVSTTGQEPYKPRSNRTCPI